MVADVSSVVHELSPRVALLCYLRVQLAVFHHMVHTIYTTYYTHRLGWIRLFYHLNNMERRNEEWCMVEIQKKPGETKYYGMAILNDDECSM